MENRQEQLMPRNAVISRIEMLHSHSTTRLWLNGREGPDLVVAGIHLLASNLQVNLSGLGAAKSVSHLFRYVPRDGAPWRDEIGRLRI
ncbi:Hypothetical protein NTJ_06895 [Nesidiocoris tenuis]|uniref:Uncharacterized protein n=1 Tax=Nesidiocoris tenuis TaxID=355587 RepID=A0ABN7APD8_9HEMI|nr:Hypothetical protein NTJ_06895 [Nesidiocoris tenuis]